MVMRANIVMCRTSPKVPTKTAVIFLLEAATILCIVPKSRTCGIGTWEHCESGHSLDNIRNRTFEVDRLRKLIAVLRWKEFNLISSAAEDFIEDYSSSASPRVLATFIEARQAQSDDFLPLLYDKRLSRNRPQNIIVSCERECTETLLRQADSFAESRHRKSAIWLTSSWLILPRFVGSRDLMTWTWNTTMNNVAVYLPVDSVKKQRHQVGCAGVYTLKWTLNGRQLELSGRFDTGSGEYFGEVFSNRKYGFNGRHLTFVTKEWLYFIFSKNVNGSKVWGGSYVDMLEYLAKRLNFTYAIVDPPEDEWGTLGADGQWSGVFGVVSRQEADAGWLPFEVTRHRARHFDFTSPTDHSTLTFVYRPAILDQRWLLLVRPLSWEVFACLAAAVPAVITVLLLTEMTSPVIRDLSRQDPRQNQHPITSRVRVMRILQRCCRVVIGAALAEPCEYEWRSGPSRLVVACWWGVALVLGAAYSGSLVAQLSYFQPLVPFRTLEEVARQTEYSWGMLGNSSIHSMILQGNLSLYRNLREGLDRFVKTDPTVLAGDEGTHFNKVVGDKYVFIGMRDTIDLWLQRDCGLVRGEDPVRQLLVAPAFAKDSALTRYFSDVIEELRAVGLVDEWHKRWMPDGSDCTTISTQRHVTVSLAHLQGAFYVVASGCGLSTLLLLLEMCLARALRHRPAVQKRH